MSSTLVEEQRLAGQVIGQSVVGQAVQRRVGAGQSMSRGRLTEVGQDPFHRAEFALPGAPDEFFRHRDGRDGDARAVGKGNGLIVAADEALLDLLLRGSNDGVREAPVQVHRHQGDDFHCFARASPLLNEKVAAGTAPVGDQSNLIWPQFFPCWLHTRALTAEHENTDDLFKRPVYHA